MRLIYLCLALIFCLLFEEANSEFTSNRTTIRTTEESEILLKQTLDNLQKIIVNDMKNNLANNYSMTSSSPQLTINASRIESERNKLLMTLQTTIPTENYSRTSTTGRTNNFGYLLEKRIEDLPKEEKDSVMSNISKLLKGIIPNGYIFGSPEPDPFGFKREHTTNKNEYPLLKLFSSKTHGIIHKKRAGNLLKSRDSKGQKIESIFNGGEDGSCENCSSILILINRNNNTYDNSESIVQEIESLQPDKIAVIELQPRDEQSNSEDVVSETISGSDSDSSRDTVYKSVEKIMPLREGSSRPTVPKNSMLMAMQSMKNCPSRVCQNTTSHGDSGGRVLKSIDVDLKLKQELTVTGSLKLNYS